MSSDSVPTLYEWAGGMAALERLTNRFYERVRQDEVLSPIFAQMRGDHPRFVAQFLAEVLGGPTVYSGERGGRDKHVMPWRIEDEMKHLGANYIHAGLGRGFAVRDGNLITGQQNFSGTETANLLVETLGA